jgi:hypothetical protein
MDHLAGFDRVCPHRHGEGVCKLADVNFNEHLRVVHSLVCLAFAISAFHPKAELMPFEPDSGTGGNRET